MTAANPPSPAPSPPLLPFRYEAQTAAGDTRRGTLDATTPADANRQLTLLQLRVLSVEPTPATGRVRRAALGPDDFLIFNQQLAHLTASGLPIERGLRLIAADLHSGKLSDAARAVADELERGVPLEQAFAHHAGRFPSLYGRLIEAGAKAGNLPAMLFNLGHHLELVARLRQTLWPLLSYPIMVVIAMMLVLWFIATRLTPQFRVIFHDFRTSLPWLTDTVMDVGDWLPQILLVVVCIFAAFALLILFLKLSGRSGLIADRLLIWIPVIGPVLRASLLARWIDALRLGIEAGLDLPHAVDLASEATASHRLGVEGRQLVETLVSGKGANFFPGHLIPQTVPAAIELSSRAGDLESTLATLTRMYQDQAEQRVRLVPVVFTPIALFLIAGTVTITVVAMFLPLVKLIQSVSGGGEGLYRISHAQSKKKILGVLGGLGGST